MRSGQSADDNVCPGMGTPPEKSFHGRNLVNEINELAFQRGILTGTFEHRTEAAGRSDRFIPISFLEYHGAGKGEVGNQSGRRVFLQATTMPDPGKGPTSLRRYCSSSSRKAALVPSGYRKAVSSGSNFHAVDASIRSGDETPVPGLSPGEPPIWHTEFQGTARRRPL